jgi:hypothetical protein
MNVPAAKTVLLDEPVGDMSVQQIVARARQGSRVRIERLTSRPECNGLEGTARKLLPDERVWVVLVSPCDTAWASVPSVIPPALFI